MDKKNIIHTVAIMAVVAGIAGISAVGAFGGNTAGIGEGDVAQQARPKINLEHRTAVQEALEGNDYNAWMELMGDRPVMENINEENFAKFVEMHNLLKEGDKEGANNIREELGLPEPQQRRGQGMKEHKGQFQEFAKKIRAGEFRDVDGNGVCTVEENK